MRSTSLYQRYFDRQEGRSIQRSYNAATLTSAFRAKGTSQRNAEPIRHRIVCGMTMIRLDGTEDIIPDDIELCY